MSKKRKILSKKSEKIFDVAIIGAGPAGISSALQAKKEGLSFILFEKNKIGGQVCSANLIENFAGILKPLKGKTLCHIFNQQIKSQGIKICFAEVLNIKHNGKLFTISTKNKNIFSRNVVVSNGLMPKRLNIKNERELSGKKIFYYPEPEKFKKIGKFFLIIGSGESAIDQAISFKEMGKNVFVATKYDEPKCNDSLLKKFYQKNIKLLSNHILKFVSLNKSGALNCVFNNNKTFVFDFVIVCSGKEQFFPFLDKKLIDNKEKSLFFAGDCVGNKDKYIANACADGISVIRKIVNGHTS